MRRVKQCSDNLRQRETVGLWRMMTKREGLDTRTG